MDPTRHVDDERVDRPKRQLWRWLIVIGCLLGALFCLYLALFHAWAGSGPPSLRPEWHRVWSLRFLGGSAILFVSAIATWWGTRTRRRR